MNISPVFARYPVSRLKTGSLDAIALEHRTSMKKDDVFINPLKIPNTGKTVWYEYDRNSDLLEIIFRETEATCALECGRPASSKT
jgi:hypothetical protein